MSFPIAPFVVAAGESYTVANPVGGYSTNIVGAELDNVSPYPLIVSGLVSSPLTIPPQTSAWVAAQIKSGSITVEVQTPPNGTVGSGASAYVTASGTLVREGCKSMRAYFEE